VAGHDEVDCGGTLPDLRRTVATEVLRAIRWVGSWLRRSARSGQCYGEDGEDCGGETTVNFAGENRRRRWLNGGRKTTTRSAYKGAPTLLAALEGVRG
jgi:hypothetical protein